MERIALDREDCIRWRGSYWMERIVLDRGDYISWVISITKSILARYISFGILLY
jgi:hypothetical protein